MWCNKNIEEMAMKAKVFKPVMVLLTVTMLVGCAAARTTLTKWNQEVKTSMSGTIFFEPDNGKDRTVFLEVRDTSGMEKPPDLPDLKAQLIEELRQKGYTLTADPAAAKYIIQANVLGIGKVNPTALEKLRTLRYGTSLGDVGWELDAHGKIGKGRIGGTAEWVAGLLVRDVTYTVIADLRVLQRLSADRNGKEHFLRVVSAANKVNLSFDKAWPALVADLARSIAGILA
jgi:hypothetical protein